MSILKVAAIQNSAGTEVYTAKAWVNFDGTGTVAIRASGNVSSIADNGTGDYTVNFTTAMPDANYTAVFGAIGFTSHPNASAALSQSTAYTAAGLRITSGNNGGAGSTGQLADIPTINIAIFR